MPQYTIIHAQGEVLSEAGSGNIFSMEVDWNPAYFRGFATFVDWRYNGSCEATVILSAKYYPINVKDYSANISEPRPDQVQTITFSKYKHVLKLSTDVQSGVAVYIDFQEDVELNGFLRAASLLNFEVRDFLLSYTLNGQVAKLPQP